MDGFSKFQRDKFTIDNIHICKILVLKTFFLIALEKFKQAFHEKRIGAGSGLATKYANVRETPQERFNPSVMVLRQ